MKRNFMQSAAKALAAFLLFFASQAYAQTEGSGIVVRVNIDGVSTDYYAGNCGYGTADWGGTFTDEFCAPASWGYDITPDSLGCDSIPAGQLDGKIALIRRGVCGFSIKALNAQKAGAVAVLIAQLDNTTTDNCYVQNVGATQPQAGETTIPVLFICRNMANQIDAAIKAGKNPEICFVRPDIDISSFFYTPSHVQTPVKQIDTDTFGFAANLSNPGTITRTNVEVTAKVLQSNGTELYSTSITIPELAPGVVDSPFTLPGNYAPILPIGSYSLLYTSKADPVGGVAPVQDRASGDFFVTQNLFANDNGATIGYRPSAAGDWAVGALYTMSAGTMEDFEVREVEFAFATNTADYPPGDVQATFYLFRINDDVLADYSNFDDASLLSPSMEWKGLGTYEAPDAITNYTLQKVEITDLTSGNVGVSLDAGGRFMVVCQYTAPTNLTFNAFNENVDLPGVSTTIFRDTWFLGGFGPGVESVMRMYIALKVKTDEKPLPDHVMRVMPNPVVDNLNLALNFDQPTDATITIADINGRVITFEDRQGLTNETLRYPLNVAAGTYLARIATKEGTLTKQFIVQK